MGNRSIETLHCSTAHAYMQITALKIGIFAADDLNQYTTKQSCDKLMCYQCFNYFTAVMWQLKKWEVKELK